MSVPFIGEVRLFAGNFAPAGWAFCDGQLLSISQYAALFSLLGTTYGGDGQQNFALPDLRGRAPIGQGQGPGLSNRAMGERAGSEQVPLNAAQLPPHGYPAADVDETTNRPGALARGSALTSGPADGALVGGGLPHENRSPYLAVNFIIALEGVFPSRN